MSRAQMYIIACLGGGDVLTPVFGGPNPVKRRGKIVEWRLREDGSRVTWRTVQILHRALYLKQGKARKTISLSAFGKREFMRLARIGR
jgi:hypothetical protein